MTDNYCVIGNPIEHSRSPWIHAHFAHTTGQKIDYGKRLIALDGFKAAIEQLIHEGYRGCNVTVPFKFEAMHAAHSLSERAILAGAANVLTFVNGRIHADNTDGLGMVADITNNAGFSIVGKRILLVGAGGAAAGALGSLLACHPQTIVVANRSLAKAQLLIDRHTNFALLQKVELKGTALVGYRADSGNISSTVGNQAPFDLIVNATSSSLEGTPLRLAAELLAPHALVYDMMYGPNAQGFLSHAVACGAATRDGLGMLVEQAALAFEIWRGIKPPSQTVIDELRQIMNHALGLPGHRTQSKS